MLLLYFIFVHTILLIPGYVLIKKSGFLQNRPAFELCTGYFLGIAGLASFAIAGYALNIPQAWLQIVSWLFVGASIVIFFHQKLYRQLYAHRFPLFALLLLSTFSCAFITLSFNGTHKYVPDPQFIPGNSYDAFNVKVLNVAQTPANDNYIPYRQAQFIINRSDPAKDSFIDEWGVHFFQRTPLMGATTAQFFTLLGDKPPIAYTWSPVSQDPDRTYQKFQIIGQILNSLFILPAYFLFVRLFSHKTAVLAVFFIIPNHFFLYNSFFTWPKSLVAFFILFSWMLLFEKRLRYLVLAGAASGAAYLAHDLAIFYIAASALLLLYWRRFRDAIILTAVSALFALPWLIASAVVYKKPSTFIYYPFSLHGIPQVDQRKEIIREFFNTSPLRLLATKLDSLFYLITPYQLIFSEGGQELGRRLWAAGIYNIPGALGLGLVVPYAMGVIKRIRDMPLWILAASPILICVFFIGTPRLLGALHFAEASVALFIGLGVWFLTSLKRSKVWIHLAYVVNALYLAWFVLYSYGFSSLSQWLKSPADITALLILLAITIGCGQLITRTLRGKKFLPSVQT